MDKNKLHIDEWVRNTLSQESDTEGIHQSWEKMSALLDENDMKPKSAFWFGKGGILSIVLLIASSISGVALWNYFQKDTNLPLAQSNKNTTQSSNTVANDKNQKGNLGLAYQDKTIDMHQANDNTDATSSDLFTKQNTVAKNPTKNSFSHSNTPQPTSNLTTTQKSNTLTSNTDNKNNNQTTSTLTNNLSTNNTPVNVNDGDVITATHNDDLKVLNDILLASTSNVVNTNDLKNKKQLDSLKRILDSDLASKNIVYSADKNEVGRLQNVKGKEIHKLIQYPKSTDINQKPTEIITEIKDVQKVKLIPLSDVEKFILNSYTLDLELASELEDDLKYVNKILNENTNILVTSTSNTKKSTNNSFSKESGNVTILTDINNYFNFRKNFYSTLDMGFNSTPGNWLPLGFQFGVGAHYYIANRFTLGIEGIYSFRNTNFSIEDNKSILSVLGSGHTTTGTYFDYEDRSVDRSYNVRYLESFQFPLQLSYHTPKVSYSAGPVIAFSSKIKYNKEDKENLIERRLLIADTVESFPLTSNDFTYNEKEFGRNLLIGFNAGIQYNINENVGLTFKYSQLFWDNGKSDNVHSIMKQTFKNPEIRLGLRYRIGNPKRIQYMLMPTR